MNTARQRTDLDRVLDDIRDKHHPENEREDEHGARCFVCHDFLLDGGACPNGCGGFEEDDDAFDQGPL
jgi:predicted adenine nucleotide alpha hydrolase (AANH) superfamily ATPase